MPAVSSNLKTNMRYHYYHYIIFAIILLVSCSKVDNDNPVQPIEVVGEEFVRAVDLSSLPQIESTNAVFYNLNHQEEDVLTMLKNSGVNTVRLRIWYNPANEHSSFNEIKSFSEKLKLMGLKVWIAIHYSDTWADPGNQSPPLNWQGISYNAIKDSVYSYTKGIVSEIHPDFIQIGNEINSGFLFPYGNINTNETQFIQLISTGVQAVRDNSNDIKIIIHYAGINGSDWFYSKLSKINYDIIGLSYYPIWHGKNLSELLSTLSNLSQVYDKDILIAETAYPFTLEWNDWTNNIVGLEEQLILPEYPATPKGQKDFIAKIKEIIISINRGIGFCYWGGELIAFNGPTATDGSPWENQALYDFDNIALPVINIFNDE